MAKLCPKCQSRFDQRAAICLHDGRRLVPDLRGEELNGVFKIQRLVGVGSMGASVWQGHRLQDVESQVAIKIVPRPDEGTAARMLRGAALATRLFHPNIIRVLEYGETGDGTIFTVMELLEGKPLDRLLRKGPVPWRHAVAIVDQLLCAASVMHTSGIVHRDIKPSNVFVSPGGPGKWRVRLLDFGIAKMVSRRLLSDELDINAPFSLLTEIVGTPQYMAPEQIIGMPIDTRSDQYSLGVLLFRMISGRPPFAADTRQALYQAHVTGEAPPLHVAEGFPGPPTELVEIVSRMLARERAHRFARPLEIRNALARLGPLTRSMPRPGDRGSS